MKTIRVGFLGLGTVGQGVWEQLILKSSVWREKLGVEFVPSKASVRSLEKKRDIEIPADSLTTDSESIVCDPTIDMVVELIGGIDFAKKLTLQAFENGKSVVTANKALICEHGKELLDAADKAGVQYLYEASVAGGIPIIKVLHEAFAANHIQSIQGILNGTSNYILTRMERESMSYQDALAEAKNLGYVEQDESLDLDGIDAAHKLIILAYLSYHTWFNLEDIHVKGIRDVSLQDIRFAGQHGYKIKLIGTLRELGNSRKVECSVRPTLLPETNNLASVDDAFNGICVQGDIVGTSFLIGRGAGREPTSSAVLSDIVDLARTQMDRRIVKTELPVSLASNEQIKQSYYLRIEVEDVKGVLSEITNVLSRHDISISTINQTLDVKHSSASIMMTIHECTDQSIEAACETIQTKAFLKGPVVVFPILKN